MIRCFAPRTRKQFLGAYVFWILLFQGYFLLLLSAFGLVQAAALPQWMAIGGLAVLPFLSTTLLMLRYQIGLQRAMRQEALTDELTRLPNRRAFLQAILPRLSREGGALMMVDIDHFKGINDTWGHGFGDDCLISMAAHLQPKMPGSYLLARLGGEEFGIMMFGASPRQANAAARRIVAGVRLQLPEGSAKIRVTNSVGVAFARPGDHMSDLLSRADQALYRAKEAGRARAVFEAERTPPPGRAEVVLLDPVRRRG